MTDPASAGRALPCTVADPRRPGWRLRNEILEPQWFREVCSGGAAGVIEPDGRIRSGEMLLRFARGTSPYAAGTHVRVFLLDRNLACAMPEELAEARELEDREAEAATARRREVERARANAARREADAFNASVTLPVRWDVGEKFVYSGLLEGRGDGRNAASVEHVRLLEDLVSGRIVRRAGDFLCTAAAATNGSHHWGAPLRLKDGEGRDYMPRPTCKACLRLLARWRVPAEGTLS